MYFTVSESKGASTPVIVEIPHAGTNVDPQSLATLAAPGYSIGRDADLYVDELYQDAVLEGASVLAANVSRYVCDLNRAEDDVDALSADVAHDRVAPHGLIWRTTTEDRPALTRRLSRHELERRVELIYRPYHAALRELVQQKLARFGFVILLCAHSMPSRGRAGHADPGRKRADVVPGSRGRTTACAEVIDACEEAARTFDFSVSHDDPYRGGFTTGAYGRPHDNIHALQVELGRRLYMDEEKLVRLPGDFERTRRFCRALVARLGTLSLSTRLEPR